MQNKFEIKNPQSNSVFGMYVDEPIGMDHPLFKVRFQSRLDALSCLQSGMSLQDAIQTTLKRMRYLFGDGFPDEIVRTVVFLAYAERDALPPTP